MSSHASPSPVPAIVGRALLVSNDSIVIGQLQSGMQRFAIAAEVCPDLPTAASLINTRKFEAIVVDLGLGEQSKHILELVRLSPSNQNSVTFAVADSEVAADTKFQPNFIIAKPLTESLIGSLLKAALGLIIQDYRRYFRCPLTVPVRIRLESMAEIPCEMMNISEGGLAVTTEVRFQPGARVTAEFTLPGEATNFSLDAEICWCDNKGRAGLHLRSVSPEQRRLLQIWLSQKIEQGIPEPVARLFQKVQ